MEDSVAYGIENISGVEVFAYDTFTIATDDYNLVLRNRRPDDNDVNKTLVNPSERRLSRIKIILTSPFYWTYHVV